MREREKRKRGENKGTEGRNFKLELK